MNKLYFILFLFHWTSAAVVSKAPCPDVKAVDNFDMAAYGQGVWYEIARYPNDIEKEGICTITYISNNNGRYEFNLTEVLAGQIKVISGYYFTNTSGIIYVHSTDTMGDEVNHAFPVHVVATDYVNYVIVYECRYNEEMKERHEYVWIQSRETTLNEIAKKAVDDFLKSNNYIDKDKLVWKHYNEESCKATA